MKEKTITVTDWNDKDLQVTRPEYMERWYSHSQAHKLIEYGEHFESMQSKVAQIENLIYELAKQSFDIVWERNAEKQLQAIEE